MHKLGRTLLVLFLSVGLGRSAEDTPGANPNRTRLHLWQYYQRAGAAEKAETVFAACTGLKLTEDEATLSVTEEKTKLHSFRYSPYH